MSSRLAWITHGEPVWESKDSFSQEELRSPALVPNTFNIETACWRKSLLSFHLSLLPFSVVLGMESKALCMPDKPCTTEPCLLWWKVNQLPQVVFQIRRHHGISTPTHMHAHKHTHTHDIHATHTHTLLDSYVVLVPQRWREAVWTSADTGEQTRGIKTTLGISDSQGLLNNSVHWGQIPNKGT